MLALLGEAARRWNRSAVEQVGGVPNFSSKGARQTRVDWIAVELEDARIGDPSAAEQI